MPDFLSIFERTLKAVRFGIFQASDQLALALDGLCRAPETDDYRTWPGTPVCFEHTTANCQKPHRDSAVASPAAAVVAPSPKQGSDSPPRDSAIPPAPSGGTQTYANPESTAQLLSSAASWISNDLDEHERNGPPWQLSRMLVDDLRVRAIELRNTQK